MTGARLTRKFWGGAFFIFTRFLNLFNNISSIETNVQTGNINFAAILVSKTLNPRSVDENDQR